MTTTTNSLVQSNKVSVFLMDSSEGLLGRLASSHLSICVLCQPKYVPSQDSKSGSRYLGLS